MPRLKTFFWNSEQRRPRTMWRLFGQLVIFGVLLTVIEGAVGVLALWIILTREGISPEALSDPQLVQGFILDNPLPRMLAHLGLGLSLTISIWLAARLLDRRPLSGFGLRLDRDWGIDFGFGLLLGAVLMALIFLIELLAGWATVEGTLVTRSPDARFLPTLLLPLISFLAVGLYEELAFRGYPLQNLAEGLRWNGIGPRAAILIATALTSIVFGAFHAYNPNASLRSTVHIACAGAMLGTGYLLTGELAIPVGVHITWNFFQGNVFGFPVSGADFRSATIVGIEQRGPDLWTGGSFGPEAGLLGLGAMALGIVLTVAWVRWRAGEVGLRLSLAEPPTRSARRV